MAKRTGVPSLVKVAREMCRLLVKFAPIIVLVYPENTTLQTALTTALAACQTLEEQLNEVYVYGS